jgi:hypothetical protein
MGGEPKKTWEERQAERIAVRRATYMPIVMREALANGVPIWLADRLIMTESRYDPSAVNATSQAAGLMQMIPSTAKAMGVKNAKNPEENIRGGMKYLGQLLRDFDGDVTAAVAGYNMGPAGYRRAQRNKTPLPRETRNYVDRILGSFEMGAFPAGALTVGVPGQPTAEAAEAAIQPPAPQESGLPDYGDALTRARARFESRDFPMMRTPSRTWDFDLPDEDESPYDFLTSPAPGDQSDGLLFSRDGELKFAFPEDASEARELGSFSRYAPAMRGTLVDASEMIRSARKRLDGNKYFQFPDDLDGGFRDLVRRSFDPKG